MVRLIAIVGWLFFTVSIGLTKPPDGQGVPNEAPAIESKSPEQAQNKRSPALQIPNPFLVRVIEEPVDAEHTKAREAKTDEHNAQDLDAQVRSAEAAEKQVRIAFASVFFALLGTGLLVWNLTEARKANAHTLRAIEQEQTNAERQLRGYVNVVSGGIGLDPDQRFAAAGLIFQNFGQTPAYEVTIWIKVDVLGVDEIMEMPIPEIGALQSKSTVSPGASIEFQQGLEFAEGQLDSIKSDRTAFFVRGRVDYLDAFKKRRTTEISCRMHGKEQPYVRDHPEKLGWSLKPTDYGNESR